MPTLWTDTIASHREAVRDAILATTARLVAEHGLRGVTMSEIAERTRIGRATLYKYFPDVETILRGWHERQIGHHLNQLADAEAKGGYPVERLEAVLELYARIAHESRSHHDQDLAAFLHQDEEVGRATHQVHEMIRNLVAQCVQDGKVRADIPPEELAADRLHALGAAGTLSSAAGVRRLVQVILAGLRPI